MSASPKVSVFIAASLDGFIARPDGGLDWLEGAEDAGGEDYGYGRLMASVDRLVMGRNTFDTVLAFPAWPYGETPVVVLTHRPLALPAGFPGRVSVSAETPGALVQRLGDEGARHLYVDGGRTIQGFLAAGVVDEMTLTRIPVLLGAGIPLFGPTGGDILLRHVETRAFPNGYVQSTYRIPRPA